MLAKMNSSGGDHSLAEFGLCDAVLVVRLVVGLVVVVDLDLSNRSHGTMARLDSIV